MAKANPVNAAKSQIKALREVRTEMKSSLVERGTEIDLIVLSFMARVHMLMLGEPGVAKSMLIEEFLRHIEGANLFEHQLNKDTEGAEIFGPVAFSAMKEDKFHRQTEGYLPWAHGAYIDEVFRSNSTVLNGMLRVINERTYKNGLQVINCPLWCLVGAANNLPTHDREDLAAFADRLGVRRLVAPVQTQEGIMEILEGQIERDRGNGNGSITTISRDDMELVQGQVLQVSVPTAMVRKMAELVQRAGEKGLRLSTRRLGQGRRLVQANALLNDRGEVKQDDLRLLEHFLWNEPDEVPTAYELCLDFAGDVGRAAARMKTAHEECQQKLAEIQGKLPEDGVPDDDLASKIAKLSAETKKVEREIADEIDKAESEGSDPAELESTRAEITRTRQAIREILGSV